MKKLTPPINHQFKILSAFSIVFVLACHLPNIGSIPIFHLFFPYLAFLIAIFIFISGYFYNEHYDDTPLTYLLRKAKNLLLPMYIWNLIYGIIVQILRYNDFTFGEPLTFNALIIKPLIYGEQFLFNLATWFVIPLFTIEIFNNIIRSLYLKATGKNVNVVILYLIYQLAGVYGVYLASQVTVIDWYRFLIRFLYCLPFYALGQLYRHKLEKSDTLNNYLYFTILFSISIAVSTYYGKLVTYDIIYCNNFTEGLFAPFIVAIIGIAFWLRISRLLSPILKNNTLIMCLADNTYAIMLHHVMGFFLLINIFALLAHLGLITNFDWQSYKTTIKAYLPNNMEQWYFVYLVVGIAFSLLVSHVQKAVICLFKKILADLTKH